MNAMKKLSSCLLMTALIFSMLLAIPTESKAAESTGYTYTVKLHLAFTGDDATASFNGADGVDTLVISGLNYDDELTLDAKSLVTLTADDASCKYYVKGVRVAGADSSVDAPSIKVTKDVDYIVAYGVGETVPYKVRYVDANGNELLPEETYYGPADEEIYVSYKYVEGYVPNTYNYYASKLNDPTVRDENGNAVYVDGQIQYDESKYTVFTFRYVEGQYSTTDTTYTTTYTTIGGGTSTVYETIPGVTVTSTVAGAGNANAGNAAAGNAGAGNTNAGNANGGNAGAGDANAADNVGADNTQTIDDTATPTAPEDVVNIEDEQTALAGGILSDLSPVAIIAIVIAVAAVIAIVAGLFVWQKNKKKVAVKKSEK